eukprot:NODE_1016_length_2633_cov_0.438043.p1 type:complete len:130 gc:universal NODE_1016_length_2633_cov_0.438043:2232-1843(-)
MTQENRIKEKVKVLGQLAYELRNLSLSRYREIIARFGQHKQITIDRFVQQTRLTGIAKDADRSGCPKKISQGQLDLIEIFLEDKYGLTTLKDVKTKLELDVLLKTLSKEMDHISALKPHTIKYEDLISA